MSVFVGPFVVVDNSGWKGLQGKVCHTIGTDDHGTLLLVEFVDNGLQGIGAAV